MSKDGQLSFFEQEEPEAPEVNPLVKEYALVYLVTFVEGAKGNLFLLKIEDAKKLCSDKCSHGIGRGGHWMFNWTALEHFANGDAASKQHETTQGKLEPFEFIQDTGKQDADFDRLGIEKPTMETMGKLLHSLGYEYHCKTTKERLIEKGLITQEEYAETEKQIAETIKSGRADEWVQRLKDEQ